MTVTHETLEGLLITNKDIFHVKRIHNELIVLETAFEYKNCSTYEGSQFSLPKC